MDKSVELRKSFWVDAGKAGGVIGLLMVLIAFIEINVSGTTVRTMLSLAEFLVLGYFIYYFSRKRSLRYGNFGYTYGQNVGYVFATMLFAGFVLGLGHLVLAEFIAPDYYEALKRAVLENNPMYDPDSEVGESLERIVMGNGFWMFSMMLSTVFYGGLIGLFASAFVKRKPDIFADDDTDNQ